MAGFLRLLCAGEKNRETKQDSTPCSIVRHLSRVPALVGIANPFATQLSQKDSVVSHCFTPTEITPARLPFNLVTSPFDICIKIVACSKESNEHGLTEGNAGMRKLGARSLFLSSALIRCTLFFPPVGPRHQLCQGSGTIPAVYFVMPASFCALQAALLASSPAKALQKTTHRRSETNTKSISRLPTCRTTQTFRETS